jgi:hypothetical protein
VTTLPACLPCPPLYKGYVISGRGSDHLLGCLRHARTCSTGRRSFVACAGFARRISCFHVKFDPMERAVLHVFSILVRP